MYILAGVTPGWDEVGAYCNNKQLLHCIWIDTDTNMAACELLDILPPIEEYELEFNERCISVGYKPIVFIYHGEMTTEKKE